MSVTGSSAWAAPRVVRVVGIQDGISDSQADYFRRTIAELNDLTEDRIFVTRPIPAASSLDLNAYQGLDFAIVSPRVFALLERYNGFIPMASLSVDIPDCEPGAELRPVVSALVFATPDADEDGLAKPHLSDIAGETVTVVKGDEVDTTFLLQNELSSRRLAPVTPMAGRPPRSSEGRSSAATSSSRSRPTCCARRVPTSSAASSRSTCASTTRRGS